MGRKKGNRARFFGSAQAQPVEIPPPEDFEEEVPDPRFGSKYWAAYLEQVLTEDYPDAVAEERERRRRRRSS